MTDLQPAELNRPAKSTRTTSGRSSANQSKDWTIKGLSTETVEISRIAAKENGMKINAWVSRALNDAASEPVKYQNLIETPSTESARQIDQHILEEISKLRVQNDDLVQTINSMSSILIRMCADRL